MPKRKPVPQGRVRVYVSKRLLDSSTTLAKSEFKRKIKQNSQLLLQSKPNHNTQYIVVFNNSTPLRKEWSQVDPTLVAIISPESLLQTRPKTNNVKIPKTKTKKEKTKKAKTTKTRKGGTQFKWLYYRVPSAPKLYVEVEVMAPNDPMVTVTLLALEKDKSDPEKEYSEVSTHILGAYNREQGRMLLKLLDAIEIHGLANRLAFRAFVIVNRF